MRRVRDVIPLLLIVLVALGLRTYKPWDTVFHDAGVDFLETDAWYHVRLVENQVRNFPFRVTFDPYAAPDGQFVPIAPMLDTVVATAVWLTAGRDASLPYIEFVAALVPPAFGALAVIAVWAFTHLVFGRREALLAALFTAVWPGHLLDRTLVGFVDHHALEAAFAFATLAALVQAMRDPRRRCLVWPGAALGAYLLSWGSGAFLVGVIAAWLMLLLVAARDAETLERAGVAGAAAAAGALILVFAFQSPAMFRYDIQVASLIALAAMGAAVRFSARPLRARMSVTQMMALFLVAASAAAGAAYVIAPDFARAVATDLARFTPSATRMAVLEARPLFLYSGTWNWEQPWTFFRSGFYAGVAALVLFLPRLVRRRDPADLLAWFWALVTLVATIGQNRFGYYLVPAFAVLGAWLAIRILDLAGVPHRDEPTAGRRRHIPLQSEAAVVLVTATFLAPSLVPAFVTTARAVRMPDYWRHAMTWLRDNTPEPFPAGYYHARYGDSPLRAEWTIMNWWDQGYWISQIARRVPFTNPTQERAVEAGQFFVETDEAALRERLARGRIRYVLADWEKPFRWEGGTIYGHFESLADWAGRPRDRFYQIYWRRTADGGWSAVWTFTPDYYRTMAYRLTVLGGQAAPASDRVHVLSWKPFVDPSGETFREIVELTPFEDVEAAQAHLTRLGPGNHIIVGLDPWRSPIALAAVSSLRRVHDVRNPDPGPDKAPWVRIYEVTQP